MKLLLDTNADVQVMNSRGLQCFHIACIAGNEAIVDMLLEKNINVNAKTFLPVSKRPNCPDMFGMTPLHLCCHYGHCSIAAKLILERCCYVDEEDGNQFTPRDHAICGEHDQIIRLIDYPLHYACAYGYESAIRQRALSRYLSRSIHIRDDNGMTPLHVACFYGHEAIVRVLLSDGDFVLDALNVRDKRGCTPIELASDRNHESIVELLSSYMSDVVDDEAPAEQLENEDGDSFFYEYDVSCEDQDDEAEE